MFKCLLVVMGLMICSTSFSEEIYLVRGWGANAEEKGALGKSGLHQLDVKLKKRGFKTEVIDSAGPWKELGEDIVRRAKKKRVSYPIILIGHSYGGRDVVSLANYLGKHKIPVRLVVGLDPGFAPPSRIKSPYVKEAISFLADQGWPYKADAKVSKKVKITTVDVKSSKVDSQFKGIKHGDVDDNKRVHSNVIQRVFKAM